MEQWQKLQIQSLLSWNVDDFLLLNKRLTWGLVKWSECNITQVTLELVTAVQKTEVQHLQKLTAMSSENLQLELQLKHLKFL